MNRSNAFLGMVFSLALTACGVGASSADGGAVTDAGVEHDSGSSVARGQYLVDHVAVCGECHTPVGADGMPDTTLYLAGSRSYDFQYDDGTGVQTISVYAENITSDVDQGIGGWTDEQVRSAIVSGLDDVHVALWPIMPYPEYANMTPEDVTSIIMYLRTVPASSNVVAPDTLEDPESPAPPVAYTRIPHTTLAATDPEYAAAERGRYLASVACLQCHTPEISHDVPDLSRAFAGGRMYQPRAGMPASTSTNITPDATGLAGWTVDDIIASIRTNTERGTGRALCETMPGGSHRLGGMTDADIHDVATYIHSLPPVMNGPFTCHP